MDASFVVITRVESDAPVVTASRTEPEAPPTSGEWFRPIPQNMRGAIATAALTPLAVLIHGYHPYAEDGGLYVSGILKALHPSLYPAWSDFVTALFRFSFFSQFVAALIRRSGLSIGTVLLSLYLVSIWATLFAGWLIARRCYRTHLACYGAVSLLALWLSMPIAGTSLLLMDPYVTARSLSTPCGLFAIAAALDILSSLRRGQQIALSGCAMMLALLIAALVHPLMAGYAAACAALILCSGFSTRNRRVAAFILLCLCGIGVASYLYFHAPDQSAEYAHAAQTRPYWFLSNWQWFELAGLVAPLLVLGAVHQRRRNASASSVHALTRMGIAAGVCSITIAALFARIDSHSYVVARLQPLRIYQTIYIVMILAVGAFLAEQVLRRRLGRWMAAFLALGAIMFSVQLLTFPDSRHIEAPWTTPHNPWEQAFVWVRTHTPRNAVFALDANYITATGEDAQNFKAIAERSALPDYAKDGGIASIAPDLTDEWTSAVAAELNLNREDDADRLRHLRGTGADWIVLPHNSSTRFPCVYANAAVKVCRLPQ